ncbi:beta-1,3-galactosyltransferase 5-like isoform X2 [Adelges cooleyi]|nr:beta-1,3-galactosyltransferase 5-like isoform X2 [Adelges cooleyi]XP_050419728.1 beta-1,3-galactosyltransferase 5-like isoform X2 [Adelges cooleyi]XP_050419729.1 beta-1,3-galactosyltransferase 5-like isoform X2 [Adelges cooleyi]XP_050419731.1 beta-1,3-galactosyltransferase 5-like isoform X2 [Adelges cooleyi]
MIGRLYSFILSVGILTIITFTLWSVWSKIVDTQEAHSGHVEYRILTVENVTSKPFEQRSLSDSDLHALIDLPSFNFVINQKVCNNNTQLIMALVHTAPGHRAKRQSIRDTWAKMIPTLFFMGLPESNVTQSDIIAENQVYSDIVQGDFVDCYRNLTYKHVMVLKWTLYYCPSARYLLKTDDDTFVNAPYLLEILHKISPLGARNLLMCQLPESTIVKRSYRSKWRVSYTEYPKRWYPTYCKGWAIVYSPDVVYKLYTQAQVTPYFWIDDVHITGTIAVQQNITQTDLGELAVNESDVLSKTKLPPKFVFCLLTNANKSMRKLWHKVLRPDDDVVDLSSTTP